MRKIGRASAGRRKRQSSAGVRAVLLLLGMLLVVTGIVGGLTAAPQKAYACSCAFDPNGNEQIEFADLIFSGTLVKKTKSLLNLTGSYSGEDRYDHEFEVDQAWKGDVYEKVTVESGTATESCGVNFQEGYRYIVLAKRDGAKLITSLCSGNALYEEDSRPDILQKLGEPSDPLAGSSPGDRFRAYLWMILAFVAAIVSALTWLGLRRRRSRRRPRA
ncbi:hypothetical protein CDO73_23410 [Saccharibacillus sp. O23]|uniref:hypothetical protein n=1 Tax=Saccharibacillus sp. O23 TaxID=2009338 RepID=UPI000B4DFADF|nr:hypothetical protein [Saccharibacillus sp. O23]OWR27198.1 hypothetical protein CDO73_23410 [Saccharibacillus sp. O23]